MINLDDRIASRLSENLMKTKIFWHLAKSFSLSFFFVVSAHRKAIKQRSSLEQHTKALRQNENENSRFPLD